MVVHWWLRNSSITDCPFFLSLLYLCPARRLIDKKVKEIHDQVERGEEVEGMYLTYLLSSNKLSLGEVYISLTELLLGGVDTVRTCVYFHLEPAEEEAH